VELGFVYDSSIFPLRHDRFGIPNAERAPHQVSTSSGKSIVEWPLVTAKILGFRLPVAGGGYLGCRPIGCRAGDWYPLIGVICDALSSICIDGRSIPRSRASLPAGCRDPVTARTS